MTGNEPDAPTTMWKQQSVQPHILTPQEIRARIDRLDGRIRRRNRIEYIAGALVLMVFAVFAIRQIARGNFDLATMGAILSMFGAGTVIWQLHRRTSPVEAIDGARPSVEIYCMGLRRQRDALASVWLWYVAPCVPGLVAIYVAVLLKTEARNWPFVAAMGLIQIAFVAWVILINRRAARVLDAELEAQAGPR
ncbi:hypothetical protein [Sphingomonas colocasiae]|uniref:Uncharacterized protein n=1 Tax=Sphingomonas colocasiae TaxID=1848973 RepID=A0ABS7PLE7_9SPHN|nr:hypothetical protein [Sphingomonas colocasiae]MBY8820904.1 hypothetical protein [Sphingomonas colocasiae]